LHASSEGIATPSVALTDSCANPIPLFSPSVVPRLRSLCRLCPAPAASGIFPTLSLGILPKMPGPLPRRYRRVHLPVSSPASSAFPWSKRVGFFPPRCPANDFQADVNFGAADISLCSGLLVCWPPRSFPPLRAQPQGSRGFYVRAERASLPPHASDMLAVLRPEGRGNDCLKIRSKLSDVLPHQHYLRRQGGEATDRPGAL